MKKVVISTRQVVADFKARIGDAALMEKYSLSPRSLINLKKELLSRGLITPEDIKPSRVPPNPNRKALSAKQFVADFRQSPDDRYMMEKYSLTPDQLRIVYRKLIESRMLSEYEYYMREGVIPELNEPLQIPASASEVVNLVEQESTLAFAGHVPKPRRSEQGGLPEDFFRDVTGVPLKGTNAPANQRKQDSPGLYGRASEYFDEDDGTIKTGLRDQSTYVQLLTCELCPNCGRRKDNPALESCPYCGIVFSKASYAGAGKFAVWDKDISRK